MFKDGSRPERLLPACLAGAFSGPFVLFIYDYAWRCLQTRSIPGWPSLSIFFLGFWILAFTVIIGLPVHALLYNIKARTYRLYAVVSSLSGAGLSLIITSVPEFNHMMLMGGWGLLTGSVAWLVRRPDLDGRKTKFRADMDACDI